MGNYVGLIRCFSDDCLNGCFGVNCVLFAWFVWVCMMPGWGGLLEDYFLGNVFWFLGFLLVGLLRLGFWVVLVCVCLFMLFLLLKCTRFVLAMLVECVVGIVFVVLFSL